MADRPALRLLASTALAVALFAGVIARLRRTERPSFEPVSRAPNGVVLGRVRLARRGESGRIVGWSVHCDGREVWSRLGVQPALRLVDDGSAPHLQTATDGREIALPSCH